MAYTVESINGHYLQVTFAHDVQTDAAFYNPASYTLTPINGAPATILAISSFGGATTTIAFIEHTGTTLVGFYSLTINGLTHGDGSAVTPVAVSFLSLGETPTATITSVTANAWLVQYSEPMMLPADSGTAGEIGTYQLHPEPYPFPDPAFIIHVDFPNAGDDTQALLYAANPKQLPYTITIEPATAIEYDGTYPPETSSDFLGIEVNPTHGGSYLDAGGLVLQSGLDGDYAWHFGDLTGKAGSPDTSLRVDFTLDASLAVFDPEPGPAISWVGSLLVEDGTGRMRVTFARQAGMPDQIIVSGPDTYIPLAWSTGGPHTLSVMRNHKTGLSFVL